MIQKNAFSPHFPQHERTPWQNEPGPGPWQVDSSGGRWMPSGGTLRPLVRNYGAISGNSWPPVAATGRPWPSYDVKPLFLWRDVAATGGTWRLALTRSDAR